jgi:hypothetical protein
VVICSSSLEMIRDESMKRKCLAVGISITAIVLLILTSLTNVIGYQAVKSSSATETPLFSMRTQRANNQQQNSITSQYLGKGRITNLLILSKINDTVSLNKIISKIQAMDDVSFQRFVGFAVEQLSKQDKLKDVTPYQLITELHKIRYNLQAYMNFTDSNKGNITRQSTPTLCWFPGCVKVLWEWFLYNLFIWILTFFSVPPTQNLPTYNTCHCCIMGKTHAKQS